MTIYNFRDAFAIQQNKGSKVMPTDLHSVQWNVIAKEATQWMAQLQNEGGAPRSEEAEQTQTETKPGQTQQELEEK
ncbi:MAG: hypothetical protein GY938_22270 [Ketobacter sp.]|nr:hypothetical protein [Ketobacter sp.]